MALNLSLLSSTAKTRENHQTAGTCQHLKYNTMTEGEEKNMELETPADNQENYREGRWGEDSEQSSVNIERAQAEFEEARRELSHIASTRPVTPHRDHLTLSLTRSRKQVSDEEKGQQDDEGTQVSDNDQGIVDLEDYLKRTNREKEESGIKQKKVGVSFRELSVIGFGGGKMYARTYKDEIIDLFGGFVVKTVLGLLPIHKPEAKPIIRGFNGVVKPKEMLLVLGKPGSGSSTFLRALTNQPRPFTSINGDVHYSGVPFELAKGRYRGEILFNDEDDVHLPTLTVEQTLRFALKMKTPKTRIPGLSKDSFVETLLDLFLSMFGMKHTLKTNVGNAWVRGVSGGERKRVSIMEAMASRATINAYDNSTRGLDSSTAIDYIRSLRILTTLTESTTIVTLYQAGESIYKEFDKVCLIDSGREIYFGPASEARAYFEDLGYEPQPRSTTADFLTSITNSTERLVRKDMEGQVPITPQELEAAFRKSKYFKQAQAELDEYDNELKDVEPAKEFAKAVSSEKNWGSGKKSPYVVSFYSQVASLTEREFFLKMQDRGNLRNYFVNVLMVSLIIGALFYNIPKNSSGAFLTGGASFFSIVVIAWLQMGEGIQALMTRQIAAKQVTFAFYRPSALFFAQMLADIPLMTTATVLYTIIVYFMIGFKKDAGAFFIHLLFSWMNAFTITTFYRAAAAWASDVSNYFQHILAGLNAFVFFAGYMQSRLKMRGWYRWLSWITPVSYALEAVITNQYSGEPLPCSPDQTIPGIPGVSSVNQVCNVIGGVPGDLSFDPAAYAQLVYGFTSAHIWRNFGIMIAFWIFFVVIGVVGVELRGKSAASGGMTKIFVRKHKLPWQKDDKSVLPTSQKSNMESGPLTRVTTKTRPSLFTFKNINYSINDKQLLHDVEGIVKPGVLLALMGASGAGKTTLLDNLSQRKRVGIVQGDLRIDGRPLQPDFGRNTGYVEQMDVHDGSATVREAVTFSAILRQPKSIPKEEKLAFVAKVLNLLGLDTIEDAMVAGLNIEEKKRVTIAVELAARPDTLLFLDEPTSGLDSNGALSIVSFLRKLARESGLCIICTIHQPSSVLFSHFDEVLLLAAEGRTAYFGEIGHDGTTVLDYYARNGARPAEQDANPAEYILETVRPGGPINWSDVWQASPERRALVANIDRTNAELAALPAPEHSGIPTTYAMPFVYQANELIKRTWRNYWRNSTYEYSKIYSNLALGLMTGIIYFDLGDTVLDLQSRVLATFIAIVVAVPVMAAVQPKFLELRMYYEARERNSKIYSAPAWLLAMIVCEIPYVFIGVMFFFFPYYYMIGLPSDSKTAAFQYIILVVYQIFMTYSGIAIAAICPNIDVVFIVNPLFFSVTFLFTGILVPYPQLQAVFRRFLFYVNPAAWATRSAVGNAVHGIQVACSAEELVTFHPPSGQTCAQFAGEWLAGATGYFVDANARENCQYCTYKTGDEYLSFLNIKYDDRFNYFGYLWIFVFTNIALVFIAYAAVRDVRWSKVWAKYFSKKQE
ncbi:ABC multidrug transporter atrF [Drechslerella dactyloides]|uniref:ABC multidrug transporter atrF n=1 Tax=Drechslerella dactyloides TaxID=74499 RepID=A0AAD6NLI6_DREDA|nr:ABC multidrug transporter atrF [Drechslerella dactyloides]